MKNTLFAIMILSGCFVSQPSPDPDTDPIQIQVTLIPSDPGCYLSKVRVHDDQGAIYQAQGCNQGIVELSEGRSLGWVEVLGVESLGWAVYVIR
jgi:hypothetical protein